MHGACQLNIFLAMSDASDLFASSYSEVCPGKHHANAGDAECILEILPTVNRRFVVTITSAGLGRPAVEVLLMQP